jgi:16S rRNA (cytosine967-C5)-methyltransferase
LKSDRLLALEILIKLRKESGSLSSLLAEYRQNYPDASLALIREQAYGVCRWYPMLLNLASQLLEKPMRRKDLDIDTLILLGLYQLYFMRIPDHAAINETVALTRALKKDWASKLVNAVLRNAVRRKETLSAQIEKNDPARLAHPDWMIEQIRNDWPDQAESVLAHNNRHAPMTLRANLGRTPRKEVLTQLRSQNIHAEAGAQAPTAISLSEPTDVFALPGFKEGILSVQDEASQLASGFLNAESGFRVLDACAAPGGKTCAILEQQPALAELIALDNNKKRLGRVYENLERLGLNAKIICADAIETGSWWDGEYFDAILLDAPCSGSGVIRRNPDIKLLRKLEDLQDLAVLQQQMLAALWQCLKPGGRLLYSTCSVFKAENTDQVLAFLKANQDAEVVQLTHPSAHACEYGLQFLPGPENMDGFFYAMLNKTAP